MGRGTRILIAALAGALTAMLLFIAIYTARVILGVMEMNALISRVAANPDAYVSTPVAVTYTANGGVYMVSDQMGGTSNAALLQVLAYLALTSLGGLIVAFVTYRLLARVNVRE